ncbi:MTRF1L release factor glutamine methyltransferase [Phlebotomus argentipes]|uniref:MTRF1L release factor glutamine methyltransferase n=1 Tax=Phlebotomus argentipes TaxID=94469 RepID=UPI0028931FDF|nr:MTRF1L release factor glutamine methyltransferase [Phlebotomus argentipes]
MLRNLLPVLSSKYFSAISVVRQSRAAKTLASGADVIDSWRSKLEELNVPDVKSSLDNILGHVLQQKQVHDLSESKDLSLTPEQLDHFEKLCHCRVARMPIQYIVGEWEFRDLVLKMQPPVFIPRPETEELVELILQKQEPTNPVTFLEIGCGCGAVSLALLKALPLAKCKAVDQSSMACLLTLKNAIYQKLSDRISVSQHKISDRVKDDDFSVKFDFIVSNPPYISSHDLMDLDPEIRLYEDLRALDGGEDGMNVIKSVLRVASKFLSEEGTLWLEVDSSHPELVVRYLDAHRESLRLKFVASYTDLFQNDRFVEIVKEA